MSLKPTDPETAVDWYLKDRANELADSSLKSHEYQLKHFIRWCSEVGIQNLDTLTGRNLHRYRLWRGGGGWLSQRSQRDETDGHLSYLHPLASVLSRLIF